MLRTGANGEIVRLGDVARVELGARDYSFGLSRKGRPVTGAALQLAPNANALQTAAAVYAKMAELGAKFPAGLSWAIQYDTSKYVRTSMREIALTFFEALVLVFFVVWVPLQPACDHHPVGRGAGVADRYVRGHVSARLLD